MLKISENRRYLIHDDGRPFFYLGDTAWELFHRLNRPEADHYLRDRAAKGFSVIQAVVLAEADGLRVPNPYGHLPLEECDPERPVEAYFEHVDYIVNRAAALGLHVGLLPTWGDKWNPGKWGKGPEVFTPESAHRYGLFLGRRYADAPLIWVLGGDRVVETAGHRAVLEAMAAGLREGDGGRHLITLHPPGGHTSSEYFHAAEWLDFNMWQSGHARNRDNYACIAHDYGLSPTKPCMDAEPGYEDHSAGFNLDNGYLDDYDVRKSAYWALFAGAHGHTYGCHPVWQMWQAERQPYTWARRPWYEALQLPGASHMGHVRRLIESRPFLTRVPDPSLVTSEAGVGTHHVEATRGEDGSYAFVYVPSGRPVEIDLEKLSGADLVAHWYDPRTGAADCIGTLRRSGRREFTPPPGGPDWVLVLDDTERRYPTPGKRW
jgi:hypothetical protein